MVGWAEMPRSPGHVFYDRLQSVLIEGGFDGFAEAACRSYYAARLGAPSVPPGRYFRMHLVGYFEGIDSERGLEWRCSDSLSLREFLRLESRDRVPDHSWLSRTRARLPHSKSDPEAKIQRIVSELLNEFGRALDIVLGTRRNRQDSDQRDKRQAGDCVDNAHGAAFPPSDPALKAACRQIGAGFPWME